MYFGDSLLTSPSAKPVTSGGMPYATQWFTPPPPRPSRSTIIIAKLLVPAGGLTQDNCGETFSPTQCGFCGKFALLLATFGGIIWPSLKVVDVSPKNFSCASAVASVQETAKIAPPDNNAPTVKRFIEVLPYLSDAAERTACSMTAAPAEASANTRRSRQGLRA